MVSICKVKNFFTVHLPKENAKLPQTKKLLKLGPLFICSFGTYDIEVHVEVRS